MEEGTGLECGTVSTIRVGIGRGRRRKDVSDKFPPFFFLLSLPVVARCGCGCSAVCTAASGGGGGALQ